MKEIKLILENNQVHFVKVPKEAVNIVYKDLSIEFRTPLLNGLAFLNHSIHLGFEVKEIIKVAETADAYCPNCEVN